MYEVELRPFKDYNPQNNQKLSSRPASSQIADISVLRP